MKNVAIIILNRNLPEITDKLGDLLVKNCGSIADIFVVEAGSDENKLSRHCTWWNNSKNALKHGLRTPRGFNYGLCQLYNEGKFQKYDYYFLLCNDTEFEDIPVLQILLEEMSLHPRLGILSPCSKSWGERQLLSDNETKYFWYIQNCAYLMRREYIEAVMELNSPNEYNFLYDGHNFRGYCADLELAAKAYANDWACGVTTCVWCEENEEPLKNKADVIKTEDFDENIRLYIEEGRQWMRSKYGFNSRWTMQIYAKNFYENFFEFYPEFKKYKI